MGHEYMIHLWMDETWEWMCVYVVYIYIYTNGYVDTHTQMSQLLEQWYARGVIWFLKNEVYLYTEYWKLQKEMRQSVSVLFQIWDISIWLKV